MKNRLAATAPDVSFLARLLGVTPEIAERARVLRSSNGISRRFPKAVRKIGRRWQGKRKQLNTTLAAKPIASRHADEFERLAELWTA